MSLRRAARSLIEAHMKNHGLVCESQIADPDVSALALEVMRAEIVSGKTARTPELDAIMEEMQVKADERRLLNIVRGQTQPVRIGTIARKHQFPITRIVRALDASHYFNVNVAVGARDLPKADWTVEILD